MASKYELIYFDGRGRGEITRLLFTYANQEFKDTRVSQEQWAKDKSKYLYGWLPILNVQGAGMFCDSAGIARYVARELNLAGKTSVQQLQIDQVVGICGDALQQLIKLAFADETQKERIKKEVFETKLPGYLNALEAMLKNNKNGFFFGDSITLADIYAFDLIDEKIPEDFLKGYPLLKANADMVGNSGNIKKYLAQRPKTPF